MRINEIFHVGVAVLSTAIDAVTNTVLAQLGSVTDEYTFSDNADWYQHVGFASRPSKPTKGEKSSEAVAIKTGVRDVVIASRDGRSQQIYGNLKEGETAIYAAGVDGTSQAKAMFKDDGSATLLTTNDNTATGQLVAFQVSPTKLAFTAPWGSFVFDASGFHLKTAAGPRLDMGGISVPGLPAAVASAISGYANITAPAITVDGSVVNLGHGPVYQPVANMPSAALLVPVPGVAAVFTQGTLSPSVRVSVT